jgi:hypothetical protein
MKEKDFNGTPHFYSLLQGEIRDGRKNFKRPLTLTLSRGVEREEKEGKDFKSTPHFCPLPRGGEG